MLRPGNYRNCHGHLVFAVGGEPQLVVGDIPCLDANHAAPGRVAEIGHGGRLFGPRVPHHARPGADFFNDDAAAPPAIFEDAPRWRIEVDPVGLRPDGDERASLRLAPFRFGLVDIGGARDPEIAMPVISETAK
jgi:hypothetical protein